MQIPIDQLLIGVFALFGAAVTGAFSVYNTKLSKKITRVEQKTEVSSTLTVENNILSQVVPVLKRKDEALDKIAEILENILRAQELTTTQLKSLTMITETRCQALDLIKTIKAIEDARIRKEILMSLKEDKLDATQIRQDIAQERVDKAAEGYVSTLDEIIKALENGKSIKLGKEG